MSGFMVTPASTLRHVCYQCLKRHGKAALRTTSMPKQLRIKQSSWVSSARLYSSSQHDSSTSASGTSASNFDIKDPFSEELTDSEYYTCYSDDDEPLYENHIPTTILQKALLAVGSAGMSLYDPYRHDMIAVLGETTGPLALENIRQKMLADPEGRQILEEEPRINTSTVDMKYLSQLPEGTFGREYVDFMTRNKITSDSRVNVSFVDDPDLAYVMQRYREVHDLNHALLGMPTTMLGEIAVKWFEMIQTGLPMCALGAVFGPLRLRSASKHVKLVQDYLPWVFQNAASCKFLLNVYYEKRWEDSFDGLRKELGLIPFDQKL